MKLRPLIFLSLTSLAVMANAQYAETNLVSDGSVPANVIDPDLQNPWGLASSPTSPIWVANNATDTSTLYTTTGAKLGLTVAVNGGPTGIVYNSAGGFQVSPGKSASFIFDSLDGTISAWAGGTSATTLFSVAGASYTGLGILGQNIYAANAASGNVDVFNSSTGFVSSFTDSSLTGSGYTPFNVQAVGSDLYVTFASGGMGGYLDEFDASGNLLRRVYSQGVLDCPWGIALAPSNFGQYSNDLLVGNNDAAGWINAFNPTTGAFIGTLDENGNPVSLNGLWGISFGNGAASGPTNTLYFTAGANDLNGLYGSINAVPEPASILPLLAGALGVCCRRRRR
jgi:uncharacterized protein (TIGR03118 family)